MLNNIKTYKDFYFLHIPKTGGRLYLDTFILPVEDNIINDGIIHLYNKEKEIGHRQWIEDISEKTYVTSIFRDPVEHCVSLYSHVKTLDINGYQKNIKNDKELNKKNFFIWIEKHFNTIQNYQSKHIMVPTIDDFYMLTPDLNQNNLTNKDETMNKVSKISLLLKTNDLTQENVVKVQNKILLDLRIDKTEIYNGPYNSKQFENKFSKKIYKSLTKKEKQFIETLNPIDLEIYETSSLFWNPNSPI
jgi:hypothetical protein